MKKIYCEFKNEIKDGASKIKSLKMSRKDKNRTEPIWSVDSSICALKYKQRHNFICYCEMRGTPYERIEVKTNTPPDRPFIDRIKKEWTQKIEEAIRSVPE